MAEYCTEQDMVTRFGEDEIASITDRSDSDTPIIDDDVLNAAIADASAQMDGELLQMYEQPVKPFSNTLILICCDIARWLLYEDSLDVDQIVQRRYDMAIELLSDISSGVKYVEGLVAKSPSRLKVIRA